MLLLALVLGCSGSPSLTFAKGVCAEAGVCHIPMGANVLLEPRLADRAPDGIRLDSSNESVVLPGTSSNPALALWRTVGTGTATLTLTAEQGGFTIEHEVEVTVHEIADLGLAPPDDLVAGTPARFTIAPRAEDGTALAWDWLWIESEQWLCIPDVCTMTLDAGDHLLWNGTQVDPVPVTVR